MLKHLAWLACGVPTAGLVLDLRARAGPLPVKGPGGLIKADQNFQRGTAERGVEGWIEYFAEDSEMFPAGGGIISGKAAIREAVAPLFATPEFSLRWKSASADISASRDLGHTYRTFASKPRTAEGQPVTGTANT